MWVYKHTLSQEWDTQIKWTRNMKEVKNIRWKKSTLPIHIVPKLIQERIGGLWMNTDLGQRHNFFLSYVSLLFIFFFTHHPLLFSFTPPTNIIRHHHSTSFCLFVSFSFIFISFCLTKIDQQNSSDYIVTKMCVCVCCLPMISDWN